MTTNETSRTRTKKLKAGATNKRPGAVQQARSGVDLIVEGVHEGQEAVVDVARSCVETVARLIPDLWDRPVTEGAPSLQEFADAAFDVTHKAIDAQRDITQKVAGTLSGAR